MRIINDIEEMTQTARGWLASGTVGLVPIMSTLHEGHRSLILAARSACEICVVTLLPSDWQFGAQRNGVRSAHVIPRDLLILQNSNVDAVFIPRHEEFFPPTFSTHVMPSGSIAQRLQGAHNAALMRDFATMITKLFHLVRPDNAYFGQKDAQQAALLRQLVRDLNIDVRLSIQPTVRESDGLAISSRNIRLSPEERQAATILYRALLAAKAQVDGGEIWSGAIEQGIATLVATDPLVTLEYASVCDPDSLSELASVGPGALLALAATIGEVYLVDNILWLPDGRWRL